MLGPRLEGLLELGTLDDVPIEVVPVLPVDVGSWPVRRAELVDRVVPLERDRVLLPPAPPTEVSLLGVLDCLFWVAKAPNALCEEL